MRKLVLLGALAAVAGVLAVPALSTGYGPARLAVLDRLGPEKRVAPYDVRVTKAVCPRRYVAISGQMGPGALDIVYSYKSSPRTWEVALGNSNDEAYTGNAGVVCGHGNSRLRVRSASLDERQALIRAWRTQHPHP
jgi:hypothetical protein